MTKCPHCGKDLGYVENNRWLPYLVAPTTLLAVFFPWSWVTPPIRGKIMCFILIVGPAIGFALYRWTEKKHASR